MATAKVNGLSISYEVFGNGQPWAITSGGRFSKDPPGVRELAQALAERGNRVLIWDRPNTGESDVSLTGAPRRPCRPTRWPACWLSWT